MHTALVQFSNEILFLFVWVCVCLCVYDNRTGKCTQQKSHERQNEFIIYYLPLMSFSTHRSICRCQTITDYCLPKFNNIQQLTKSCSLPYAMIRWIIVTISAQSFRLQTQTILIKLLTFWYFLSFRLWESLNDWKCLHFQINQRSGIWFSGLGTE